MDNYKNSQSFFHAASVLHRDLTIHIDIKGIILYVDDSVKEIFGYESEELIGKNVNILMPEEYAYKHNGQLENRIQNQNKESTIVGKIRDNLSGLRKNGEKFPIELAINEVRDDIGNIIGFVGYIHDITKRNYVESYNDINNLLNQKDFERQVMYLMNKNKNLEINFIVILLDDIFLFLNNHEYQKNIFKKMTSLITSNIRVKQDQDRESDMTVGLLGYSFGIATYGSSVEETKIIAERLRKHIEITNMGTEDNPNYFTASIGVVKNDGLNNIKGLLNKGIQASQEANDIGGNRVVEWIDKDKSKIYWKSVLEKALIGLDYHFELYTQNIKPSNGKKELHYEVLIRLFDDILGEMISPAKFIPISEELGLSVRIDKWVIENTFKWLSENPDFLEKLSSFSINLSGPSLSCKCTYEYIYDMLKEYNISPNKICFEVTETSSIKDIEQSYKLKYSLKELGFQISLDDYGTGNSSAEKLIDNDDVIDKVKIDGKFINGLINSKKEYSIKIKLLYKINKVCSILKWSLAQGLIKYLLYFNKSINKIDYVIISKTCEVAKILGIKVIAEYVNTEDEQNILNILGVDYFQGYESSGKPEPIDNLKK